MPTSSKQDYLAVLQELVAFAEGDTLQIPLSVLKIGGGLLVSSFRTNAQIVAFTKSQREFLQLELRHFLRGIANGHAVMIKPIEILIHISTHVSDSPAKSRRREPTRAASYAIDGSPRDWVFSLVDRVLPHVSLEALRVCPSCGRAFVKVTRKKFCSTICQTRTYMRHWRADHKGDV